MTIRYALYLFLIFYPHSISCQKLKAKLQKKKILKPDNFIGKMKQNKRFLASFEKRDDVPTMGQHFWSQMAGVISIRSVPSPMHLRPHHS